MGGCAVVDVVESAPSDELVATPSSTLPPEHPVTTDAPSTAAITILASLIEQPPHPKLS
jgi:hypothetical protein